MSIQSVTGAAAFAGASYQNGIRLAVDEANRKGVLGSARIKLIERDNASDKGQAINLANQAIDRERVVLSLGPSATSDSVGAAPVFNDKRTPMMSMASSDAIIAPGPWVFKFQQSATDISPRMAKYVLEKTPVRKVAMVYDRGNEALIEYKNYFRDPFKAGGGTVVAEEAVVTSDTNFLPLVTKLKAMDLDAVYLATYSEQSANIILQLRQAGLPEKVRFIGTIALVTPRFLNIVGKAAEGTLAVSEFVNGMDRPLNKAFEAAYKARYNAEPDGWAATGYSSVQVALAALRNAGANPDRQKVRDALMTVRDVPVVVGSGSWNHSDRRPRYGSVVLVVKDGKFVQADR
ncbi:ABC transporter substrate-binding protein [Cupriavidus basilensis]|uniref:Branched-chain amino acid ABC transporter, amino acid-binding protein n=1 Tax=Cupriavidus basilensis TaxID=68895 RepID=A0A0C4YHI5_9BURK|nr:ABC transporter substrate-binding protein [Cupriavidus basilensis]AJG22458.1 Branched-chain amino acid ABC transporter, amino acid-binding protein [Cupriavidus basilensis]